ncbi:zinc knuckle CX2CX4HX4C containing protein [Tanacetum coccineum]
MEHRKGSNDGEVLLRNVASRMKKMTGKGDADVSQPRMPIRGHRNPNSDSESDFFLGKGDGELPVCSFPSSSIGVDSHDIAEGVGADCQDEINPTSSHLVHGSNIQTHNIDDVVNMPKVAPIVEENISNKALPNEYNADDHLSGMVSPSNPIVQSVDINIKSTSYAGDASANFKEKPKVSSNFRPLVADPVFNGVKISILRKVIKKVSTRFEHTLYGYFIRKRFAFPVVEYYARNNWGKHGLKRIMMNTKGFFFFKFDSRAGLVAVLESGPWMIRNTPIILKKWSMSTSLLKDELTNSRHSYLEYVHDHGPKKVKKRKGKSKSTNGGQFAGPSVKQIVRYELKATTNAPKKGANNMSNPSKSPSMLKTANSSPKKDNFTTSNSFSALNAEEEDDEEEVENVYDESANLVPNTKTGERSSFTAVVG